MKILFFPKYTRQGASSRLRTYQFIPYFEKQGVRCESSPLFDDSYLNSIYQKKSIKKIGIIKAYLHRILKLFTVFRYDLIFIEKELFPYLPAFAEQILSLLKVKYVVDYDDAIFHNYDLHPNKGIQYLLKNKIASVMNGSSLVVTGNAYLQAYAQRAEAKNIIIIPTVINTDQYALKEQNAHGEIIIGWIGSPITLKYVRNILPVLRKLRNKYPIRLHIIGGKEGVGFTGYEEVFEWSEETEAETIRKFDIGLMPLNDDAWEQGKCGYKLIQYMGCGLPVVGSPVGVNKEIIQDGMNGFKAATLDEWEHALEALIKNKDLRVRMGLEGRKLVEEKFSLSQAQEKWVKSLRKIL